MISTLQKKLVRKVKNYEVIKYLFAFILGLQITFISSLALAHPALPLDEVNSFEELPIEIMGGWQRGDVGSVHVAWDIFESDPDPVTSDDSTADGYVTVAEKLVDINALPLFTTFGTNANTIIATPGLGIFKTSTDNWYSFSSPSSYTLLVTADAAHQALSSSVTVVFQLANQGSDIDDASIKLVGVDHDNNPATATVDIPFDTKRTLHIGMTVDGDGNPLPDGLREYLYSWTLEFSQAIYALEFTAASTSMSLDALAFDAGPTPIAENVPMLPLSWMLVLASLLVLPSFKSVRNKIQ